MLKVFIADDEYYFRQALKESIDWTANGFSICGEANNGDDAISQIQTTKPDIILLDINMPMLNGLEVMQIIKEEKIRSKVIIISGHDEFNYALQAIELGVHSFILKPVNKIKLLRALNEIRELINQEKNISIELDQLKERISQNQPLLRNQLLHMLLYGNSNLTQKMLAQKIKYFGIDLLMPKLLVVAVEIDASNDQLWDEDEQALWSQAVTEIIEHSVLDRNHGAICTDNYGKICIILGFDHISDEDIFAKVIPRLFQVRDTVTEHLNFTVTIGVGGIYSKLEDIKVSYNEAVNALSNRIIVGDNKIIPFHAISDSRLSEVYYTTAYRQQLLIEMRLCEIVRCYDLLDRIFGEIRLSCTSSALLRITCIDIISTCLELLAEMKMDADDSGLDLIDAIQELQKIHRIEDMEKYVKKKIEHIVEAICRTKKAASSIFVGKALAYIHQNHTDPELNLKEIAENVFVNYGHLCYLFKRETGVTMNDYISDYRLSKAKELIDNGHDYVLDIANQVGFSNANYFSKCFKKRFGMSPRGYIEQTQTNDR